MSNLHHFTFIKLVQWLTLGQTATRRTQKSQVTLGWITDENKLTDLLLLSLPLWYANWTKLRFPDHWIAFVATFKLGHLRPSSFGTIWIVMYLAMIFAFDLEKSLSWWLILVVVMVITLVLNTSLLLNECWAHESKNKADENNHCEHQQDEPICRIHDNDELYMCIWNLELQMQTEPWQIIIGTGHMTLIHFGILLPSVLFNIAFTIQSTML